MLTITHIRGGIFFGAFVSKIVWKSHSAKKTVKADIHKLALEAAKLSFTFFSEALS